MSKPYKFVETQPISYYTNLTNREFNANWIEINHNGVITVNPNKLSYAWDGCSPKFNFLDLTFGTPDGKLQLDTQKPITYYASLLHDAIYQHKSVIPISRKEADTLFYLVLKERKFFWRHIYYICVRCFGGTLGKWILKSSNKKTQLLGYNIK